MIKFLIRLLFLSAILPYQFNIEPDFGKIIILEINIKILDI